MLRNLNTPKLDPRDALRNAMGLKTNQTEL